MTKLFASSLVLALIAACAVEAPSGSSVGEEADAIVGGTVNQGDPAVFQLKTVTPTPGGSTTGSCTATLVTPTVLLTAAHCIDGATAQTTAWVNNVTVPASQPSAASGWRRVKTMAKHPLYPRPFANHGYDCAVLVLEEAVAGVAPKTYRKTPLVGSVGRAARIVGYGNTNGTTHTGGGTKRELATKIKEVRDGVLAIGKRGAVSCQGDSGGPAFVDEDGVEVIAGVSSYGDIGCVETGSYARTELCAEFFDRYASPATSAASP